MNNLKRLALAISLTLVLAGAAFADDPSTPPCPPNPGELNTPPCSSTQLLTDGPDAGQASLTVGNDVESLAIAAAMSAIEDLLTIY